MKWVEFTGECVNKQLEDLTGVQEVAEMRTLVRIDLITHFYEGVSEQGGTTLVFESSSIWVKHSYDYVKNIIQKYDEGGTT